MAERNKNTQVVILSVTEQGEQNRSIRMLSADMGLFYATLYGGAKNKLRSMVQAFTSGTVWFYADEVKKTKKIKDFDIQDEHPTLRTNLYKLWAANLASEILLKTKCAGEEKQSYVLFKAFIDGIDKSDEKEARLGTVRFLWRYLGLLGVRPAVDACSLCGIPLGTAPAVYSPISSGLLCRDCFIEENLLHFSLSTESLAYLKAIEQLPPGKVRAMTISAAAVFELKSLTFYLIEEAVGSKLKTIETGMGIL